MASESAVLRVRGSRAPEESEEVPADDLRCSVTFCRTHPTDCRQRQIFVRLDERSRLTLVYGDALTEDVAPGSHRLRIHNTLFWKTITFTIEPGEHLECLVINRARWWTYGMAGLLGAAPLFLSVRLTSLR